MTCLVINNARVLVLIQLINLVALVSIADSNPQGEQMTLWRMLGLFLVLASGLALGLILIICEYTFAGYRDVVEDRLQGVGIIYS